jgi:trehalose-6-phosphate synthase
MSLEERQARHGSLVKVLSENDIKHWGTRFIATLTRPTPVASVPRAVAAAGGSYFAAAE